MLESLEALHASDPVGEGGHDGLMVMAVEEIAELGITGDPRDAEGGVEVVGLLFALKAALELKQRLILNVKQCEGTEVTVAQRVANFAELACVDNPGHGVGDGVDEGAETK